MLNESLVGIIFFSQNSFIFLIHSFCPGFLITLANKRIDACWDEFLFPKPFSMFPVKFSVNFVGLFEMDDGRLVLCMKTFRFS